MFDTYRTAYDVARSAAKDSHVAAEFGPTLHLMVNTGLKAFPFVDLLLKAAKARLAQGDRPDSATVASIGVLVREWRWLRCNKPRYRVYPHMVEALASTSIDIDAQHLHLPFPAISIELPKNYWRENDDSPFLRAILLRVERPATDRDVDAPPFRILLNRKNRTNSFTLHDRPPPIEDQEANLTIDMDFGDEPYQTPDGEIMRPCKPYGVMGCEAGKTIDQHFDEMPLPAPNESFVGYMPSLDFQKSCLRIAVAVAFLAINHHEVVAQFIPDGFVRQRQRATVRGDRKKLKKIHDELSRTGNLYCFDVGRELVVNVERGGSASEPEAAGRPLKWGHMRSGFMRWQPYGPREAPEYKLIFINPTLVRKDLPLRPTSTHAIK